MSDQTRAQGQSGGKAAWARLRCVGLGLACAVLTALAFPPVGWWAMALLAPAPLMVLALRPGLAPGRAGMYAAVGVAPWWAWAHLWTVEVSRAGIYPLVVYLSLYAWAFVWIAGRAARRWPGWAGVILPVAWVGLEFLRGSVVFYGYAFYLTGHPLIDSPGAALAAPGAWLGAYAVSLLAAGVAAGVALLLVRRRAALREAGLIVGVAAAGFAVAAAVTSGPSGEPTARISVVQSNIPQDNRMAWTFRQRVADWRRLRDLTILAGGDGPDLIVWPEGLMPGRTLQRDAREAEREADAAWPLEPLFEGDAPDLEGVPEYIGATSVADELLVLQRALGVPLLVGAAGYEGFRVVAEGGRLRYEHDAMYNSAFLIVGGEVVEGRYDKLRLAPFGEVMPYISAWPWLEDRLLAVAAEGMSFVLASGGEPVRLEVPREGGPLAVATPICFEATDAKVCRRLVFEGGRRRAGVLVSISNDGWFGDSTAGREAYILASRWRCVELATPMLRAANTGISGAYDARGRVISETVRTAEGTATTRDRVAGVLTADVAPGSGATLYAHVGDAVGWVLLGATGVLLGGSWMGPRRPGEDRGESAGHADRSGDGASPESERRRA